MDDLPPGGACTLVDDLGEPEDEGDAGRLPRGVLRPFLCGGPRGKAAGPRNGTALAVARALPRGEARGEGEDGSLPRADAAMGEDARDRVGAGVSTA